MGVPPSRIVLPVLCLSLGVYQIALGELMGWIVVAAGAGWLFAVVRAGAVVPAFRAMARGDIARAKAHLEDADSPDDLSPRMRAYYEWVSAGVAEAEGDDARAGDHLERALRGELPSGRHRVIALCSLASLRGREGKVRAARSALAEARAERGAKGLAPLIARVESELGE